MSMRYQAGIVLPGYNALKVANAPTIGTATAGSSGCASVTFTAPSCVGGGAVSSYTVFACCGVKLTSGASSPLVVTGLTVGQAYTFKVIATNAYGPSYPSASSNSATPVAVGQQAYTTAGTYSWVAPAGVTSVSVVAVGGGGGFNVGATERYSGGGGGALAYANNISVTPSSSYTVVVGAKGDPTVNGGNSTFNSTSVGAQGGRAGSGATGGAGGTVLNGTGGSGGAGGSSTVNNKEGGGGGAGGYSGNGGAGGTNNGCGASGGNGSGGGGGGGAAGSSNFSSGNGGGVGILGQGSSGAGGTCVDKSGVAGSGGSGPTYGGGSSEQGNSSGVGAVRIIYPGTTRSFPSTNTGNL